MFAFEPIDPALLVSEPPPTAPLVGLDAPPVAQTPSLGRKQSAVRWLPGKPHPEAGALALAGSWDEPENELAAWRVRLDSAPADDALAMDDDAEERGPQRVGAAPHDGCVLGLAVAGTLAFTASGAGGVSCYAIEADEDEAVGGEVALRHQWRGGTPQDALATLGVASSGNGAEVAAVGEDGGLVLLTAERGAEKWRTQSREPTLYAVGWWDESTLVVGGTVVSLWDVRARGGPRPSLTLAPTAGAQMHLAAPLVCVSAEPEVPRRLAAGAADGTLSVWDVRAAGLPPSQRFLAHGADVWDVQLGYNLGHNLDVCDVQLGGDGGGGGGGEPGPTLLSCSSDGWLYEWSLDAAPEPPPLDNGRTAAALPAEPLGCTAPPARRALVQLPLPINSLELSPHGMLAAASDAQTLTFVKCH